MREQELSNGLGQREEWEHVHDYDVYIDLGVVDKDILSGFEFQYPRRVCIRRDRCKAGIFSTPFLVKK